MSDPTASNTPADTDGVPPLGTMHVDEPPASPPTLDSARLNAANGDATVWAEELARFISAITGKTITADSFASIFGGYGAQVQALTYTQAALAVANTPIPTPVRSSKGFLPLMDFRGDIAEMLLATVQS